MRLGLWVGGRGIRALLGEVGDRLWVVVGWNADIVRGRVLFVATIEARG